MKIKYSLQVWDTQAFPLVEIRSSPDSTFDLPKVNQQRLLLMQQHAAPTPNVLACAETLQQLAETLSSVHPWMKTYLQDLSEQFRQQSTAVLTINVPKKPSRFTILAYFVTMIASQHRMVTYNAAGDFYILPLPTGLENSRFLDLYKNSLESVPCTHIYSFMKIYRNALIAEKIIEVDSLLDWSKYSPSKSGCEYKARLKFEEKISEHLCKKEIDFVFDKNSAFFEIPIKLEEGIVFFLSFNISIAIDMIEADIGSIDINHYITASHQVTLEESEFFNKTNEIFQKNFDEKMDEILITTRWSAFDLRENFNEIPFSGNIREYNTWAELFSQIDRLIDGSKKIINDIHSISDFLNVVAEISATGVDLKKIIGYKKNNKILLCYLMYSRLLNPNLFLTLSKEIPKLYNYTGYKESMINLIDYIQNYELSPS